MNEKKSNTEKKILLENKEWNIVIFLARTIKSVFEVWDNLSDETFESSLRYLENRNIQWSSVCLKIKTTGIY